MGLRYEDEPDKEYRPQTGFARGNNPRARAVICDGVEYACVNDCADFYHVKFHTMINWLTKEKRMPKNLLSWACILLVMTQRMKHKLVVYVMLFVREYIMIRLQIAQSIIM